MSRKIRNYTLINFTCILLIFAVIITSITIKITNLRINDEIKYISMKLSEQDKHLKIYRAELAIITNVNSLTELYKAYYGNANIANQKIAVTQIKTVDHLVGYFNSARRYSSYEK